jgi:sirohydrochlorin cobaltochelatase
MSGPELPATTRGIVLFAHGSRDARWREPVEAVARRMQALDPEVPVLCAYLELVAPDLPAAASQLVARGASDVHVVPLFLGMGKHVRDDLPRLVAALRNTHPGVAFSLASAVGEAPEVIDLLARIALRG